MIEFDIGSSGQRITISNAVGHHLRKHAQIRWWQREAGGQLFATFDQDAISISFVTGPRLTDARTRTSYHPDKRAEQREIDRLHRRGLHFVGDWHTHPEARPTPSPTDRASISECFASSKHNLRAFVLLIVGTAPFPEGLHVSLHNDIGNIELQPSLSDFGDAEHKKRPMPVRWI